MQVQLYFIVAVEEFFSKKTSKEQASKRNASDLFLTTQYDFLTISFQILFLK